MGSDSRGERSGRRRRGKAVAAQVGIRKGGQREGDIYRGRGKVTREGEGKERGKATERGEWVGKGEIDIILYFLFI